MPIEYFNGIIQPKCNNPKVIISIKNFEFLPNYLIVPTNTIVEWINLDNEIDQNRPFRIHNITSKTGLFQSQPLSLNDRYSHRFMKAGDYYYYCSFHPAMSGLIRVVDPSTI